VRVASAKAAKMVLKNCMLIEQRIVLMIESSVKLVDRTELREAESTGSKMCVGVVGTVGRYKRTSVLLSLRRVCH